MEITESRNLVDMQPRVSDNRLETAKALEALQPPFRPVPKWAKNLMLAALEWWEAQGNTAPNVTLHWGRTIGVQSSGFGSPKNVYVAQGPDRLDAKLTLLHEIAHALMGPSRAKQWHYPGFWDVTWRLYRWAKIPIRHCHGMEAAEEIYKGGRHTVLCDGALHWIEYTYGIILKEGKCWCEKEARDVEAPLASRTSDRGLR